MKKKNKTEIKAFTILLNKLLEKEIREEDLLSDPEKMERYSKLLDKNLSKIFNDWKHISGEVEVEKKVERIFYYYELLKYVCVDKEKHYEIYRLWQPRTIEKLKEMGQWETCLSLDEQYDRLDDLRINADLYESEDPLADEDDYKFYRFFISRLRKCENEKCGKWFVQKPKNKRFCNQRCAAKYNQRINREKDRQGFNKYHRDDYQKRKKRKGGGIGNIKERI
jgi:hypothetical protein